LVALVAAGVWLVLLASGLFGESAGLPSQVTGVASVIAALSLAAFFVTLPAATLYVMLLEMRSGAIRKRGSSVLAIRRRWAYAVAGAWALLLGLGALTTRTRPTAEFKLGGVVLLVWGLSCFAVSVLAFRMEDWLTDPRRTR
jgi:hypothetical protein